MKRSNKVPPDGGYGWVIVFANALSNFISTPLMHCFGLIFTEIFTGLKLTATQSSLIISLNAAFGMMTGLINGVLLKTYGCRKIAILSAFLLTGGVILTSYSKTFTHFIVSYGLITSLGMGLSQSAFGLAVNQYFVTKRSYAVGLSETITGFGPILIPQVLSFLMVGYSASGVTLIFGGICAHVFIAAALLQPLKWHMKVEENNAETLKKEDTKQQNDELSDDNIRKEGHQCYEPDTIWNKIVKIFDLDLLKDPIFANIMMGMALAIFAELNFTVLTPFMLHDYKLNTTQIATFLSTLGAADIIFRFFAPHIGNFFNKPARLMYAYSLVFLIITRFTFLLSTNFYVLMVIAIGLGTAKGIRKVYMSLVIPNHVTIDKLATANGMEMMMNGFCIIIGGPLLGVVRDVSGSYRLCVVIMNCVTATTLTMWLIEFLIFKLKKTGTRQEQESSV